MQQPGKVLPSQVEEQVDHADQSPQAPTKIKKQDWYYGAIYIVVRFNHTTEFYVCLCICVCLSVFGMRKVKFCVFFLKCTNKIRYFISSVNDRIKTRIF